MQGLKSGSEREIKGTGVDKKRGAARGLELCRTFLVAAPSKTLVL